MPRPTPQSTAQYEKKMESFHKASEKLAINSLSANLNVLISSVRKVGAGLIHDYNELEHLQSSHKSPSQFIKRARENCESKLQVALNKARPTYGFLFKDKPEIIGEDTSHKFICDVINGEMNFSHSIPFFCITVAIERNKEIINSIIFNPITDELFYAEQKQGAFLASGRGNVRLKVTERKTVENAIIATSDASKVQGANLRIYGCPALTLAYLAAGKIDACWEYDIKPWDVAAGLLLIKEARGVIKPISTKGNKDKDIIYANDIFASNGNVKE